MNVVIYTKDFQWAGGIDFLHGLVLGLLKQDRKEIKLLILVDENGVRNKSTQNVKRFIQMLINRVIFFRRSFRNLLNKINTINNKALKGKEACVNGFNYFSYVHEVFKYEQVEFIYYNSSVNGSIDSILKKNKASVLLPVLNQDGVGECNIPKVGYIFDFVYKYLPSLYTTDFCLDMDISYAKTIKFSKSVIVNSQKTAKDAKLYFPYKNEIFVTLPFAPYANIKLYKEALEDKGVLEKYEINKPYFMICNQLWLHKDHETAFKALEIVLRKSKHKVNIICTGTLTDLSGTQKRLEELKCLIKRNGIEKYVKFLGHIPKKDQLSLVLQSSALIQPTKFEGGPGGGSVYMSTAYGIESIVSDIEVNKEIQNENLVTFFEVSNFENLAAKMITHLEKKRVHLSPDSVELKNKMGLKKLGEVVLKSIEMAMD